MQDPPEDTIDRLRELMPVGTLTILPRALTVAEAKVVAERQAHLLLELLGITEPSVDIERVMELPEVNVEVLPGLPRSGSSAWANGRWQIQVNADDSLWRCRATLAHELKHVLDDPFVEILYPNHAPHREHAPVAELICEYFAGCVLVPKQWLLQAWHRGQQDPDALASRFDVSRALIMVRLRQVGLISPGSGRQHWRPYNRQPGSIGATRPKSRLEPAPQLASYGRPHR